MKLIEQKISPEGYWKLRERILRGEIENLDVTREAMIALNLLPVPTILKVDMTQ